MNLWTELLRCGLVMVMMKPTSYVRTGRKRRRALSARTLLNERRRSDVASFTPPPLFEGFRVYARWQNLADWRAEDHQII